MFACPRWVASYGVMPQTYIRAVPSVGPTSTSPCALESYARTRTATFGAGSSGTGRERQACTAAPYRRQPERSRDRGAMSVVRLCRLEERIVKHAAAPAPRAALHEERRRRQIKARHGQSDTQNGGQGMDGHWPFGRGRWLRSSRRSARRVKTSTSSSSSSPTSTAGASSRARRTSSRSSSVSSDAAPAPQQRAQLVLDVERDAVVDAEEVALAGEDVAALAVGVVHQHVEDGQPPQRRVVGVDDGHGGVVGAEPLHARGTSPAWAPACWAPGPPAARRRRPRTRPRPAASRDRTGRR